MLQIYNTLTHKKEEFGPIRDKQVKFYSCGLTVYDYDHIGHAWRYLSDDILRRVLEYLGYKVKHVMNITDVGHLVSDADEGEDKLEKGARREGKTPWQIAEFYTKIGMQNRNKMNFLEPHIICKVTEHIEDMIELNKKLVAKGFAYEADDAVYFDISKFPKYGRLSGNTIEQLKAWARIEVNPNKKDPHDFAVWMKAIGKHKNHAMLWDSPWGKGFPGWHIECSAMSMKYLGETLDIHTGGEDNIFPHHECEIAQSESATGKKFVNTWMHTRFLNVEGQKMSKSLNNFLRIQDLEERGFEPLALRYLFLTAHYRSQLNFTWKSLEASRTALDKLRGEIWELGIGKLDNNVGAPLMGAQPGTINPDKNYKNKFIKYISDDFNIPQALALSWDLLKSNLSSNIKLATIVDFDKVFGLKLDEVKEEKIEIPDEVLRLAKERQKTREDKDFVRADVLREKIKEMGFVVEDLPAQTGTGEGFEIKQF